VDTTPPLDTLANASSLTLQMVLWCAYSKTLGPFHSSRLLYPSPCSLSNQQMMFGVVVRTLTTQDILLAAVQVAKVLFSLSVAQE
jgi:hypothetical protein